ncbi:MAG: sensor histidine kinase, partial [Lachnospiraceae bacterium]|nr:sensor histidine kinase [Lachnospiraceae bacterium]
MSFPTFFLYFLCSVLFIALLILYAKLYWIRKSIKEICEEFKEHLGMDTNTLLTVSSGDRQVCWMAEELNWQLRVLREERLKYQRGD